MVDDVTQQFFGEQRVSARPPYDVAQRFGRNLVRRTERRTQQMLGFRAGQRLQTQERYAVAALQHDLRLAVDINQAQGVARIDQMRILDARVDVPNFRPQPWIAQVHRGDAP